MVDVNAGDRVILRPKKREIHGRVEETGFDWLRLVNGNSFTLQEWDVEVVEQSTFVAEGTYTRDQLLEMADRLSAKPVPLRREPRVVGAEDEEPDRGATWRDSDGDLWHYRPRQGRWATHDYDDRGFSWEEIQKWTGWFPFTEVFDA